MNLKTQFSNFLYASVLLGILILIAHLTYRLIEQEKAFTTHQLIPQNAIFAYQSQDFSAHLTQFQEHSIGQTFFQISKKEGTTDQLQFLDSLSKTYPTLEKAIVKNGLTFSFHKVSKKDFGLIFYVELPFSIYTDIEKKVSGFLKNQTKLEVQKRFSNEETVFSLTLDTLDKNFDFIIHENHLIGSFHSILIEDVIRHIQRQEDENKESWLPVSLSKKHHLLVNANEAAQFFQAMGKMPHFLNEHISFQSNMHLAVQFEKEGVRFVGKVISDERSLHTQQEAFTTLPKESELAFLLPSNTLFYKSFGFENGLDLYVSLKEFWKKDKSEVYKSHQKLLENSSLDIESLYENMIEELTIASVTSHNSKTPSHLFFSRVKDVEKFQDVLLPLSNPSYFNFTNHSESGSQGIMEIEIEEVPMKLFGSSFRGFPKVFYTFIDNYWVVASNQYALYDWVEDIENGFSLAQTEAYGQIEKQFLETTTTRLVVNVPLCWSMFLEELNTSWETFFVTYQQHFLECQFIGFETTNDEQVHIFNSFGVEKTTLEKEEKTLTNQEIPFKFTLTSPPFMVKNHYEWTTEKLLTDRLNQLWLVGAEDEKLWKIPLGSPIQTPIYQIDRYNNGKLQYLFGVKNKILLIDRLGRTLRNFPIELPAYAQIEQLSVIDFEGSKNYRFLASDTKGNVFMHSKYGTLLKGWQPRKFNQPLVAPIRHIRLEDKDYLIAYMENGWINIVNPQGKSYAGFPLHFDKPLCKTYQLNLKTEAHNSEMHLLSVDGEFIRLSLTGKLLERKQLPKSQSNSNFDFHANEVGRGGWIISQSEGKRVTFLNANREVLFNKNFEGRYEKKIQFFDFGFSHSLIAITDVDFNRTSIFFTNGDFLKEIEGNQKEIRMELKQNQLTIYWVKGNKLVWEVVDL